jgi:hypothetical protein
MKTIIALMVVLLSVPAMPNASQATLIIRGGSIVMVGDPIDTLYSFSGDGFEVLGVNQGTGRTGLGTNGGVSIGHDGPPLCPGGLPCNPNNPFRHNVVVDGVGICDGDGVGKICGFVSMVNSPFVLPPDFDFRHYDLSAPFTATGHLDVGDGFDLIGAGFLRVEACFTCGPIPFQRSTYTFVAPEPSTWLLLASGLVLGITCTVVRRRRFL